MQRIYTVAKIAMTAISTLAIIWISYLTYFAQKEQSSEPPKVIVQPVRVERDTIFVDSLRS